MKTEEALKVLTKALEEDPSYAHSWHCNLAMSFYDAMQQKGIKRHHTCDDGASRFMKLCFGIETSNDMLETRPESVASIILGMTDNEES